MTKNRAVGSLVMASVIWGFGFIATIWALRELTTLQFLFDRAAIALILGAPFVFIKNSIKSFIPEIKYSFVAGLFLALMMYFQTQGLLTTTAANSGFLTCLYVVFIPFLHFIFWRHKPNKIIFLSVFLACIGTYLLSGAQFSHLTIGDALTVICAFFAALQIIWIGRSSGKTANAFIYNYFQTFWCWICILPFCLFENKWGWPVTQTPWTGLIFVSIASTLIAFAVQVKAQRYLSTTLASLLCLLEAPFALIFGAIFLQESLGMTQIFGALIIFSSAIIAVISEIPQPLLSQDLTKKKLQ